MKRALTVSNLLSYTPDLLEFEDEWLRSFGKPECTGSILIYGMPKMGKTSFALKFAKYLTRFGSVIYDSIEEGKSQTFKLAVLRENMKEAKQRFHWLNKETVPELVERLKARRSPRIIFFDSIQFAELTFKEYKMLKETFPNKLFVFISHVDGREPDGRAAKRIKRDADVFVYIEGFRAFPEGRYGGGESFDIWPEKAQKYWNGKLK